MTMPVPIMPPWSITVTLLRSSSGSFSTAARALEHVRESSFDIEMQITGLPNGIAAANNCRKTSAGGAAVPSAKVVCRVLFLMLEERQRGRRESTIYE